MPVMSGSGPAGGDPNPFQGIFGELARLLGSGGQPLNWDIARQVAPLIASDGAAETNVDPLDRIRLESLTRVAELQVNQVSSLDVNIAHVDTITPVEWARRTLASWTQLLEQLATSLAKKPDDETPAADFDPSTNPFGASTSGDPFAQFANMEQWMSPVLLGMQAGGMVGHLAKRSLGLYDLPIPRAGVSGLVFVPENIARFADEWSLPLDELSLYVCIEEATRTAVITRPHVARRLNELLGEYVSAFEPDSTDLQERLGDFDLSDPNALPSALSDPQALLGAIQTPAQLQTLARLSAIVAAFVGYVDHVVDTIASRTVTSAGSIAEAVKRRRVEESDGQRLVEKLFGLELAQPTFDRGDAFVAGVIERAGEDGLARLWKSERELPTPAEIDAPGLWLERIDLPPVDGETAS